SGENVVETPATGTVTFSSENTLLDVPIPAGTQVTTASGIAFATTAARTVKKATFSTGRRGTVDAPVTAVKNGTAGNVSAKTIVRVPSDLAALLISVSNPDPTIGGTHVVSPMIVQADIDQAEANLRSQLDSGLQKAISAPGAVPSGSNLFSDSAKLGDAVFTPDPQGLLNQAVASFDLSASATGTAVVADMAAVRSVAESRIKSAVRSGYNLVAGSITTQLGTAATQGDAVLVPVTAEGLQTPIVDAGVLREAVLGKTVEEARTYLAQFGRVDISVDPGWASTMPSWDFRIDVRLSAPSAKPTVQPSESTAPTPSLLPTPSAVPTPLPAPSAESSASASPAPASISPSPPPVVTSPGPSAS
ncbi:MAG: baseplate J/gp47 family protein, partial [Candidatus Limnocylindrales bacterium]